MVFAWAVAPYFFAGFVLGWIVAAEPAEAALADLRRLRERVVDLEQERFE